MEQSCLTDEPIGKILINGRVLRGLQTLEFFDVAVNLDEYRKYVDLKKKMDSALWLRKH